MSRGLAAVREHALDAPYIRFADRDRAIELSLDARGLTTTKVGLHALGGANLAGGREGEPLFGAFMRLELVLRHD